MAATAGDFINRLDQLKSDIRRDLEQRLTAFKAETGITPSSITVAMGECTQFNDRFRQFVVVGVTVKLGEL